MFTGKPRLIKMARLTLLMVAGGNSPIRSFKRRLSNVRICSNKITLSFTSPSNISNPDDYLNLLRHCYVRNAEVFAEYEGTHPEAYSEEET